MKTRFWRRFHNTAVLQYPQVKVISVSVLIAALLGVTAPCSFFVSFVCLLEPCARSFMDLRPKLFI